jgi:hypothetical protein
MNSAITNTRCLQKNLPVNVSNLLSHLLYMSLTPRSASSPRARLPTFMRQYSSKLDQMRGPLRTTSDGNLVYEDTGDWLVLDTPSHDAENPSQKEKKNAPTIDLPEAKNGATGDERPRKRMLFSQYVSHSLFRRKQIVSGDPVMKSPRHPHVLHSIMADVPAAATQQGFNPRTILRPAILCRSSTTRKLLCISRDKFSGGSKCRSGTAGSGNRGYQVAELWTRCMCKTLD